MYGPAPLSRGDFGQNMRPSILAAIAALSGTLPLGAQTRPTPQTIPVIDLPAASATTKQTLGAVLGMRETNNGRLLVNDAGRRQLLLFDTTLTMRQVVFDSVDFFATSDSKGRILYQVGNRITMPAIGTVGASPRPRVHTRASITRMRRRSFARS